MSVFVKRLSRFLKTSYPKLSLYRRLPERAISMALLRWVWRDKIAH